MIRLKKPSKKDLPLLSEYEIQRRTTKQKDAQEKLKVIGEVNEFLKHNYQQYILIYYFFFPIGCYNLKKGSESIFIKDSYQYLQNKVLKKIERMGINEDK